MIAATTTKQTKILVVEDDKFLLNAISRFIEQHGYTTLKAENGLEAMKLIKKDHPALIISDLNMPIMDGFGLLDKLILEAPQTPVIILSGVGDKMDIIQAFRAGAWDYVTKPIEDIDSFIDKIGYTLMQAEMNYDYSSPGHESARADEIGEIKQGWPGNEEPEPRISADKLGLQNIIDSLKQSVALLDVNHSLLRVNRNMADRFNGDPDELVGTIRYLSTNGFNNKKQAVRDFASVLSGQKLTDIFFDEDTASSYEVDLCPYYDVDNKTVVGCVYTVRVLSQKETGPFH